ncbi:hypothetical protein [Nitrolancea hollandica]|uniref:Uncharacterized protein n=1 Tax=Nitrolancea hollandica Lb TaxID=1129897 RepID=I4EL48_9BACT|nr:hypothetical protein [Nitrolancea hollandica]CCF85410.1 hypothetical protein NITHO_4930002 [Nitrolancea hollandica Lb]
MANLTVEQLRAEGHQIPDIERLDDIFELKPPMQDYALMAWVQHPTKRFKRVLIKTASGKPWKLPVKINGEEFHIPPAGRRVFREEAVMLFRDYGLHGKYHGKDQATGVTQQFFDNLSPAQQDRLKRRGLNINTEYLTHDVSAGDE